MNERLTKLFLSSLILAIPIFATVKAKADMERNKSSEYMLKEDIFLESSTQSPVYSNTKGGRELLTFD